MNESQRLFALLTLGLEKTAPWTIPANTPFTHMLGVFSDWIAPLRIATLAGAKVRPARLEDLSSLDSAWLESPGNPERYAALGADLVAIYRQPAALTTVNVTYARAPALLANPGDMPEVPAEYHPRLVDYGIYRMRQVEGAQEFEKTLPLFGAFLDAAQKYAAYIRARNLGQRYDRVPFEITAAERSRLLKLRKDVVPASQSIPA